MTAFNFTMGITLIQDGTKLSTIRKTKRCSVGDTMQLYENQRRPTCRKLRDSVCVGTAKITITDKIPWAVSEVEGDINPTKKPLHEQEGFPNVMQMVDFFRNHYGLPFTGWLHAWRPE